MAVIKYDSPDGAIEYSVDSQHITYDEQSKHWRIKAGEQDGRDVYELIPRERVYSVKIAGKKTGTSVTRSR